MFARVAYGATAALTVAVVVAELLHAPTLLIFAASALALIGLAWVLGQATESLGHHSGPRIGGILNATFGNAAELIITIFALSAGLTTVVKASIIGSIIGNVLLVLGASLLFGGLKNGIQDFSAEIAGINASMLAIVAAALSLPTIFAATSPGPTPTTLSIEVAVVMFVLYVLYLLYILRILGSLLGHPLRLTFTPLELGALGAAVVVTGFVALDGRSNWLEGAMLCGVYIIAALAFFFSP